jgi:Phage capsid protein
MPFSNANNATYNLQATYKGDLFIKSDVASWIKQQWSTQVRRALEQRMLMRQYVMNVVFPDGKVGDRVTIPTLGRLGVNTKVAGVPVTLQKTTTGSWQILIDQYKEISYMEEDLVSIMLDPSGLLMNNLAKEAAYAINRDLDAFLLGLRAAVQNIGGSQVIISSADGTLAGQSKPFTLDAFLRAKLALDKADVPSEGRILIVSPVQFTQLLALDKVQSMFYRTSAPLESGIVGTLLGVPVYMTSMVGANSTTGFLNGTTAIPTPGVTGAGQLYYPTQDTATTLPTTFTVNAANDTADEQAVHTAMMFHRDAFALAMLMEPRTETSRETAYLSDLMVTSTLYGARMFRSESAVLIHTNAQIPTT